MIHKPAGIPTQSDKTGDADAMTLTSEKLKNIGESGKLWLVHRLDRVVGGLVIFARNKESAARLSALVGGVGIEKEYLAVVEGSAEGGTLRDFIYKDSKKGKAFITDRIRNGVKEAVLEYIKIAEVNTERGVRSLVRIKLCTGRFHQIRAQFSSRGMSLVGDGKYGNRDNGAKMPALFAYRLSLENEAEVKKLPKIQDYPWSLFDKNLFEGLI